MNSRIFSASFCAALLAASASAGWSDAAPAPTPEQRHFINDCAVMSQAVLLFAKARDQGMAEMDAFTYVTRGQVTYDAGSQVGQTLQWAFDHPDEDPITVTAHFHGRCQLDAVELLTPISEAQLTSGVQICQQDHAGKPDQIRVCIDDKANAIIASANALSSAPEATDVAVAPPPPPQRPLDTLPTPRADKTIVPVPAPPPAVVTPTSQAPVVVAQAPVPAPTNVAAAPPLEVKAPQVAALIGPAPAAIPSLPPPPPAEVPAPAPTLVAVVPPAAVQSTKLAMAAVPVGVALAPVPAPPFTPEPTSVAVAPPPATHAPIVAMVAVPTAAALAPVSVPPPAPEPTDVAVTPPPATPVPQVAAVTVPSGVALAPPPAAATPDVPQLDVANALPASMAGIGKLSLGMSMDDAVKAMGSYGQDDTDEQGNPARTFLISDGHGYIELITEPGKPDVVYGIEYHGGADAKVPPILGVHLGDGAAEVLTHVGQPTSRSPAVFDRTLWSYDGRNYSFELSSGGDLITIRIAGYAGLASAAAPADDTPAPSAP